MTQAKQITPAGSHRREFLTQLLGGFVLPFLGCKAFGASPSDLMDEDASLFEGLGLEPLFGMNRLIMDELRRDRKFQRQVQARLSLLQEIEHFLSQSHDPWAREKVRKVLLQDTRAHRYLSPQGGFDWTGYATFLRSECWSCFLRLTKTMGVKDHWIIHQDQEEIGQLKQVGLRLASNIWARWTLSGQQISWWIEAERSDEPSLLKNHALQIPLDGQIHVFGPGGELVQRFENSDPLRRLSRREWMVSPKWALQIAQGELMPHLRGG